MALTDPGAVCLRPRLERNSRGLDLPAGIVPNTFLTAEAGGALVGRASIRHTLNDFLCCDDDNAASAAVIENCGGVLDFTDIDRNGARFRRYWIG